MVYCELYEVAKGSIASLEEWVEEELGVGGCGLLLIVVSL